ncbi:LLM class flavin-dependent oxidoreductase [Plantibacter sp. Mn2098]|uniref:LLM class flavin-dependent oxidoreductase n=1 Tax=Plantibacter sp. Mn2098 TaxID=3395266 RepID=UPI003BD658D9
MTNPFRLGFLTHVHGAMPAKELYPAVVDLFVAAEELGFESGWVSQHHLQTQQGRLPSPLVLLAAVAARTKRIHLGTAIVVLPLEHPVRLAEDAAVLDALSDGRLELGIGSGGPSEDQFAAFGRDPADKRALYADHDARLDAALRGETIAGDLVLQPPSPGLADRIWDSHASEDRVRAAAADGRGLLLGFGPAEAIQLPLAQAFHDAHHAAGRTGSPRTAAVRAAFPGASREAVHNRLAPDTGRHLGYHVANRWLEPDASMHELLDAMNVYHGTPADIIDDLRADPVLPYSSDLILAVQNESTPIDEAIRTLELIATEIAPALGWSRSDV